jgi:hypothetical protein
MQGGICTAPVGAEYNARFRSDGEAASARTAAY